MLRLLRNLSINVIMSCVLVLFALFIGTVAVLGVVASKGADDSIQRLSLVSDRQLNQINRGDALLNSARVSLEVSLNQIMLGRMAAANEEMAIAEDLLNRAEQRLENFMAAPKAPQGQAYAEILEAAFREVLELSREQLDAVDQMNTPGFSRLREQLVEPGQALAASTTAFFDYASQMTADQLSRYDAQTDRFAWIGGAILLITLVLLGLIYIGLRRIIIRPINDAVMNLEYIAKADLSHQIGVEGRNEISRLFAAMRDMQQGLSSTVSTVRGSSSSIHVGTREIASGNADLSSRTEQQAASLQETASSMEQLTATVKQNADNARQASSLALEASTTAGRGGEVVGQVITTMEGITSSSKKVADIIGVIDSIAFQTNILALNASVEAARAGEQGRGFAVVAGEVRNLAGRSADAAKQIKTLIEGSAAQVQEGSNLVEQAGATMREVVSSVKRVTDIMDEISAASQEQSDGIEQVTLAVSQMDEVTQQNASLVQQAAAAAVSLEEQANRLEQAVAVFRLAGSEHASVALGHGGATALPAFSQAEAGRTPKRISETHSSPASQDTKRKALVTEDDWEEF
ncbi:MULTISPECIES: methyl-accepting chemotaxis protein [Halomonadaceae]|uniref:methyl-accepting chemotaxis protein n=1 Tax=Halomonadaceae TaxID=28256 RepID=UPI00159965A7|nr:MULTISPECIES: methyl-accepting chemotaxis protein [Halomonas]QJQ96569.1 HAMP domain-containing protein [Halomonas sp. PA5]